MGRFSPRFRGEGGQRERWMEGAPPLSASRATLPCTCRGGAAVHSHPLARSGKWLSSACGRRTARGPSLTVSRSTSRARSRSPDGSSTRLSCAAPSGSVQSAVSAKASKPNSGFSAAALSASSRWRCFGSRLGIAVATDGDGDAAVDPIAGQRQPPRAEMPLLELAHQLGDQPLERLARGFGMGRRLLEPKRRARRRIGRRGGQRLVLAAQHPVERIDHVFARPGTAAPAPAAACRSARRWS